ncbi:MAG: DNA polymerase III subunit delta' C-terminal domain-containing protein [Christensenellaceae bacterium]|jgi:DNA polymerase-3 subunit delta'
MNAYDTTLKNLFHSAKKPFGAYLIIARGAEDVSQIGDAFCKHLLCLENTACDACSACIKFEHKNLVDYFEVAEEEQIRIDVVRQIPDFLLNAPYESRVKCIHIKNAQELTEQSQNYLLKLIEEAAAHTIYVLSTNQKERVLPTIRSRCVEVMIKPLPRRELEAKLEERLPQKKVKFAAAWAEGSFAEAEKIGADETLAEIRENALGLVTKLAMQKNPSLFLMEATILSAEKRLLDMLFAMSSFLRDALFFKLGQKEFFMNGDKAKEIAKIATGFTSVELRCIIDIVNAYYERKQRFPQLREDLMVRNLLFDILEVKHDKGRRGSVSKDL